MTKLRKRVRAELATTGVMLNEEEQEIARITPNGILVLNEQEVYIWLMQTCAARGRPVNITTLNMRYGITGGYARDVFVAALVDKMYSKHLIHVIKDDEGNITAIEPRKTAKEALSKLETYVTRAEMFAGLEEVDE